MKRTKVNCQSLNSKLNDSVNLDFKIGETINDKTVLDKWLTERYALFQDTRNAINEFEIHHLEWPIQKIELNAFEFDYPRFKDLIKNEPDKQHYSRGVKVLAWGKNKMKTS